MKPIFWVFGLFYFIPSLAFSQNTAEKTEPVFEQVLSLKNPGSVQISPDGRHVLYSVSSAEWSENRYDSELWLSKNGGEPFPLTHNSSGSSSSGTWSDDGKWILFIRNVDGKNTMFVISPDGGEAFPLSYIDKSIQSFDLSPDGKTLAFLSQQEQPEARKTMEERFGKFAEDDTDYLLNRLYTVAFNPHFTRSHQQPCEQDSTYTMCPEAPEVVPHLEEAEFTITGIEWSPAGDRIAVDHQPNPIITSFLESDIAIYDPETGQLDKVVQNASSDGFSVWSPDGSRFAYTSSVDNDSSNFYANNRYFIYDLGSGESREVARQFDENLNIAAWSNDGIYATAWQKTRRPVYRLDPQTGSVEMFSGSKRLVYGLSFSKDGSKYAMSARDGDEINEVYLTDLEGTNSRKLTDFNDQITGWKTVDSEVISWNSRDGVEIEGILHKPLDYNPDQKYPLLVVIHGGPTGISLPSPVPGYVYPIVQWVNKGALVLEPNYRGSAGYGEEFRSLNVRNLGVGDAWDVLSGVDHLIEQGVADSTKLGSMGWSQGGYISAFLTTWSNRFEAVSVGAGISNWMTYYVNTDIHPFTRQYLKATPWEDLEIYERTSPMTYINNASTPTLIQHGEFDRRVPTPNAYELYQGLQDVGVESQLIIYEGFGHGINKPRERLAATWHNWIWFNKYIWGEEIEMPLE
ncbi:S9 family peptidase [Rhodohalobacter mucosus]|uniref:Peptidase S9 family protein n=1 Tax=Rhodohalobacter mucosus TaxID=2079485 RepID=A0A316TWV5_9BACT|nr:S9 family peptidase [Rhodohalobacter mucosus]PWN07044.1 peptidase S9 family protein [Rhodohalobacter mucosus]